MENQAEIKVREITLILQHLIEREEVTVRFILDRLYEVATANIMQGHVRWRSLHPPLNRIARCSQPLFRRVGVFWFNHYGAELIADWLHSLVQFEPESTEETTSLASYEVIRAEVKHLPANVITQHPQVRQLRSQVRLLALCLIGGVAVVSSSFFWLDYRLKPATSEFLQNQSQPQVKQDTSRHF
ncbi:MAG: hypothetical protein EA366_15480 [Spirulina sp. DLM2.Bin59]|nr:MAG: hypothetical protein EA366_15480 [Spirulina sp. DLM2.Bin59]